MRWHLYASVRRGHVAASYPPSTAVTLSHAVTVPPVPLSVSASALTARSIASTYNRFYPSTPTRALQYSYSSRLRASLPTCFVAAAPCRYAHSQPRTRTQTQTQTQSAVTSPQLSPSHSATTHEANHRPTQSRNDSADGFTYIHKLPTKRSHIRDRVRLHVSGGRGGSGCSSYDTDPWGKGGPDGANGGRGGDVYLVTSPSMATFTMPSLHLKGQNGERGNSRHSKGRNGMSLKVPIPCGTVVSEILASDAESRSYTLRLLADMQQPGMEIMVARGGEGGLGNRAFKTVYRKQARFSTIGQAGTSRWLYLELKSIADVGLVGFPKYVAWATLDKRSNSRVGMRSEAFEASYCLSRLGDFRAKPVGTGTDQPELCPSLLCPHFSLLFVFTSAGKSSFLAAISNATPEIANYPFTTLHPQIGVVDVEQIMQQVAEQENTTKGNKRGLLSSFPVPTPPSLPSLSSSSSASPSIDSLELLPRSLRVADLPGLISGAGEFDRGLGHEFLKHIQRTSVLCYLLDLSSNDERDPVDDLRCLQYELAAFDRSLLDKPAIILANKIDNTRSTTTTKVGATEGVKIDKAHMKRKLQELQMATPLPIYPVSVFNRIGLDAPIRHLVSLVAQNRQSKKAEEEDAMRNLMEQAKELQREREEEAAREMEAMETSSQCRTTQRQR